MDRRSFLKIFSERWLKPIFLILFLLLVLAILKELSTESGLQLIKLVLIFVAIYSSAYILSTIFKGVVDRFRSNLSDKAQSAFKTIRSILNYIAIVALVYVIYKYWNEDKSSIIFGSILFVIGIISDLLTKRDKQEIPITHNKEE